MIYHESKIAGEDSYETDYDASYFVKDGVQVRGYDGKGQLVVVTSILY
jgi:hypothetical protein